MKTDKVPALVSEATWERVNEKYRSRRESRKIVKPSQAGKLSGVLYCGHCRYALDKASRTERNGERYVYYNCQSGVRYPGKCTCAQWRVREDLVLPVVMNRLFGAVEVKLGEMESNEEPSAEAEQAGRLRKRLEEVDAAIARANRRFLSAPNLSSSMEADHRNLVQEFEAEKSDVEDRLRKLDLSSEARSTIVEGFKVLKNVMFLQFVDGHPLVEAIKTIPQQQAQRKKLGNLQVKNVVRLPLCEPENLRGFLKELGARVFVFWKKNGTRCWSLDECRITAEFDVQLLEPDNSRRSRVVRFYPRGFSASFPEGFSEFG